jgi:hypothetical protein
MAVKVLTVKENQAFTDDLQIMFQTFEFCYDLYYSKVIGWGRSW